MKYLISAALLVIGLLSSTAVQAQSAQLLSVKKAGEKVAARDVPTCSKTVTSNCKKLGVNSAWIIVGALGVAVAAAATAAGGEKSVSP